MSGDELVELETPVLDEAKCTLCGQCSDLCQFKAIAKLGALIMVFPEMCHGCGGCLAICPERALSPGGRELGRMQSGRVPKALGGARFLAGRLRVGEAMSPPLMRVVKKRMIELLAQDANGDAVIDAPPGVSCPAVSAVRDSDAILLVTEPTPFGFHDFVLAWEAFTPLGKPMAVVVNRAGRPELDDGSVQAFCRDKNLPILAQIPYSRAIAEGYAAGELPAQRDERLLGLFKDLRDALRELAAKGGDTCARS
jgi:MinD superfamily P-loop ATPase